MCDLALFGGKPAVTRPLPSWPEWDDEDRRAVTDVLESGKWWMYSYGSAELTDSGAPAERSQVELFEDEFAAAHNVKRCVAVTSGSMALDICMRAIGLQPGDEVITTPYTFFATSACILNCYALPVYVDIDRETYNLDPKLIEAAITERTRAILPVHFSGELADMEAICAIADRHGLAVIEDSAQSQGVCMEGERYAGSFGRGGIFSFQASKCLNCGEGGAILTDDEEFAELAWSLRHYGRTREGLWYEHFRLGWNGRMTEFQGALLRTQLRKMPDQNARRMANAAYLCEGLRDVPGLTPARLHPKVVKRNHYIVMLRYDSEQWGGLHRNRFVEALNAEGVPAVTGYSFNNFENPFFTLTDLSSERSPYMMGRSKPINYAAFAQTCPNAMRACQEEAIWLTGNLFLGDTGQMEMILEAIAKIRRDLGSLLASG